MHSWKERLAHWDQAIRAGRGAEVRRQLAELAPGKIPRAHYQSIGALCRRADYVSMGLRLLNPVVRDRQKGAAAPTEAEKIEYAALLIRIGAGDEAENLLRSVDSSAQPEALLFQAFAVISHWNYRAAIPLLESYLQRCDPEQYSARVAKVNLFASYLQARPREDWRAGLLTLLGELRQRQDRLLQGNVLEMLAQAALLGGDFSDAARWVSEAKVHLAAQGGRDEMYAHKWEIFLALRSRGPGAEVTAAVERLRSQATRLGHFETLRQLDVYWAEATGDDSLFHKLYFGTPFPLFREKILESWQPAAVPSTYDWKWGKGEGEVRLNLMQLAQNGGQGQWSRLGIRLLLALSADFYRPSRIPTLFYRLYPQEFFNPLHSAQRIHFAVKDLRKSLRKSAIPLVIEADGNGYRLTASAGVSLTVALDLTVTVPEQERVQALVKHFGHRLFSSGEASRALALPGRSLNRYLRQAVERSQLVRSGVGRSTRYRVG